MLYAIRLAGTKSVRLHSRVFKNLPMVVPPVGLAVEKRRRQEVQTQEPMEPAH